MLFTAIVSIRCVIIKDTYFPLLNVVSVNVSTKCHLQLCLVSLLKQWISWCQHSQGDCIFVSIFSNNGGQQGSRSLKMTFRRIFTIIWSTLTAKWVSIIIKSTLTTTLVQACTYMRYSFWRWRIVVSFSQNHVALTHCTWEDTLEPLEKQEEGLMQLHHSRLGEW